MVELGTELLILSFSYGDINMRSVLLVVLLLSLAGAKEYAVLVAGSNGYWNYRHQADICHAYQVLIGHGFNPANIILFSYDDVPTDPMNPFPGQLFNHPGNNTRDVNDGCIKDYTGESVNITNFLAVLQGNSSAVQGGNGRVLTSGPHDNVFINFVDHGAPGLIAFPDTYLYADQLNATLTYMWEHHMYKQLVFYLEACESGSMFDGILSPDINVYATTAANPNQSSWGTYCYPNETVNGVDLYTCLGDLYSVNWMENADATPSLSTETLFEQYLKVKALTTESEVMEYGNLKMRREALSNYLGAKTGDGSSLPSFPSIYWNSYDAKLQTLYSVFVNHPTESNSKAVIDEVMYQRSIQETFEIISQYLDPTGEDNLLAGQQPVRDFGCLRASVETFEQQCGQMQDYALQYLQVLVNACEVGRSLAEMDGAFSQACTGPDPDELLYEQFQLDFPAKL